VDKSLSRHSRVSRNPERNYAEDVRQRLLDVVRSQDATFLGSDDYGQRYALDFTVEGVDGVATVRSLWIVRTGEGFPRLTTCYLL
jgi:hypothetical protein